MTSGPSQKYALSGGTLIILPCLLFQSFREKTNERETKNTRPSRLLLVISKRKTKHERGAHVERSKSLSLDDPDDFEEIT